MRLIYRQQKLNLRTAPERMGRGLRTETLTEVKPDQRLSKQDGHNDDSEESIHLRVMPNVGSAIAGDFRQNVEVHPSLDGERTLIRE